MHSVAGEMASLTDYFNRVSTEYYVAAVHSYPQSVRKDSQATCGETRRFCRHDRLSAKMSNTFTVVAVSFSANHNSTMSVHS